MPTCETCKWWNARLSQLSAFKFQSGVGECRKNAPRGPVQSVLTGKQYRHIVNAFPPTVFDDWCGEHQPAAQPPAEER